MEKLLILDDEEEILELLNELLKDLKKEIKLVTTVQEALEELKNNKYSIFISDIKVGAESGLDVINSIKGKEGPNKDIPVYVMSGHITAELEKDMLSSGITNIFRKPFNPYELKDSIAKHIDTSEAKRTVPGKTNILHLANSNRDGLLLSGLLGAIGYKLEHNENWTQWDEDGVSILNPDFIIMSPEYVRGMSDPIFKRILKFKDDKGIPLLIIIDQTDKKKAKELTSKYLEVGVDDFIHKPFNSVQLEACLGKNSLTGSIKKGDSDNKNQKKVNSKFIHDINNFTNVIFNSIRTAHKKISKREDIDFDKVEALLKKAEIATYQTSVLTYNIMENFRLLFEDYKPVLKRFNINKVIQESLETYESFIKLKEQDISLEGLDSPIEVETDEKYLKLIIDTLLSSAVKYSPNQSLIVIKVTEENGEIKFILKDLSPGIYQDGQLIPSEEAIEDFSKVDNSYGVGLDMDFCKQTLLKIGGNLKANNAPEGGTHYYFNLKKPN